MRRNTLMLVLISACALVGAPALAKQPVISGGGAGFFPNTPPFGQFAGDRLQMTLHASLDETGATKGTFNGQHKFADGGHFAKIHGVIDCILETGPTSVIMTGTITHGFDIRGIDPAGFRVSIGVVDGEPDTMSLDIGFVPFPHDIPPCTHTPLLIADMIIGDFELR